MVIKWPLLLFVFFVGCGGALLAFAGLGEFTKAPLKARKILAILGTAMAVLGGVFWVFSLGKPASFLAALGNVGKLTSFSLEVMLFTALVVCGIVYLLCLYRESEMGAKVFGVVGIVLAVAFAYLSGSSFMLQGRLAWNTAMLPLSFLTSALSVGGIASLAVSAGCAEFDAKSQGAKLVCLITAAVSLLAAVFCVIYGIQFGIAAGSSAVACFVAAAAGALVALAASVAIYLTGKNALAFAATGVAGALVCAFCIRVFMWLCATTWVIATM